MSSVNGMDISHQVEEYQRLDNTILERVSSLLENIHNACDDCDIDPEGDIGVPPYYSLSWDDIQFSPCSGGVTVSYEYRDGFDLSGFSDVCYSMFYPYSWFAMDQDELREVMIAIVTDKRKKENKEKFAELEKNAKELGYKLVKDVQSAKKTKKDD